MPIIIPADVPHERKKTFEENYNIITKNSDRLFLFACDQKIEHLHDDFNPDNEEISNESSDPEHFFKIADQGRIGALATQLELIARYAPSYPSIPYIAKLNSKTNLIKNDQQDPQSAPLWSVSDAVELRENSGLSICGVGATIYPGSAFENEMMSFAAQMIIEAHRNGLIAIVWMYPRGASIKDDDTQHLIAGVAGAANALGADFVKVKPPTTADGKQESSLLKEVVTAAGNSKVICSGGSQISPEQFIAQLHEQLTIGGTAGTAVGRNIFQRSLPKAIAMTQAISALVYDNVPLKEALEFVKE